jgi:alpha-tubulin suppressor-like RCC1 family protein
MKRAWRMAAVLSALVGSWVLDAPTVGASGQGGAIAGSPRAAAGVVAAGADHTCALVWDGRVRCWGANDQGQVFETTSGPYTEPREALVNIRASSIASGDQHSCALLIGGGARCWGDGNDGELGGGVTAFHFPMAPDFTGLAAPVQLSLGGDHSCALLADGTISCWGDDDFGQVGNGAAAGDVGSPSPTLALPGGATATAIAAGRRHTCAVLDDGQVSCWGSDDHQQLGNGLAGSRDAPTDLVALPVGRRAVAITAGWEHTCAVLDDGAVTCWGRSDFGRLGGGALTDDAATPIAPVALPEGRTAVALAAGLAHTCALLDNGGISCWGLNANGQLGTGGGAPQLTPSGVLAMAAASAISAGNFHTCAVLTDSRVTCWGADATGQVGNGATAGDVLAPPQPITARLSVLPGVNTIDTGTNHTCAVDEMRSVHCWGSGLDGKVGTGSPVNASNPSPSDPLVIPGDVLVTAVATGEGFTCALLVDGRISCWGLNTSGQLGTGAAGPTPTLSPSPGRFLPGDRRAVQLVAGDTHACALAEDGSVACWGGDFDGQVGNGNGAQGAVAEPTLVNLGARSATAVTAGENHSCAVLDDGTFSCWGDATSGKLGNGTAAPDLYAPSSPITVPGPAGVATISAGDFHTCAVLTDGDYVCWGFDNSGQLVNGAGGASSIPSPVNDASGAGQPLASISAGGSHTCATWVGADFACDGADGSGQRGDGNDANNGTPTQILNRRLISTTVVQISAGGSHSCGVFSLFPDFYNSLLCWGADGSGQLGNGAPAQNNGDWANQSLVGLRGELRLAEPLSSPAPPTSPLAIVDRQSVAVSWTAPADDGGDSVDHYVVQRSSDGGSTWPDAESTAGPSTSITFAGLAPGSHLFRVSAVNGVGPSPYSAAAPAVVSDIITIEPARLLDTRAGAATIDGVGGGGGAVGGGTSVEIQVAGRGTIPADATGAVLNLTVTGTAGPGFATAYPCGDVPNASSVNYTRAGQTVPNLSIVRLSATGTVCVFALTTTDMLIDATGYLPAGSSVTTMTAARLLDTRPGEATIDGQYQGVGVISEGTILEIPIAGRAAVPADAAAVIANITVTEPSAPGFVSAFPCDDVPNASTVNYTQAGQTVPNAAVVKLSPTGSLCVFSLARTHLIIDISGYIPTSSSVEPLSPARLLDTRVDQVTVDGQQQGIGPIMGGTSIEVPIAGRGGVPAGARTAILNVTVTNPAGFGFVTIYPCTPTPPNASNLNFGPGQTVPNAVVAQLSATGTVCAFSPTTTDLIIDVTGYA